MTGKQQTKTVTRALALLFGVSVIASVWSCSSSSDQPSPEVAPAPDETVLEIPAAADPSEQIDYSRFQHSNQAHSSLPCSLCHTRSSNSAQIGFPGKPGHLPCAGCHAVQFSDQASPMCTICHSNPQTGAIKPFPGLRSFGASFNHAKHLQSNCATCHKPAQRGVAKTIPSGVSAHVTCFQCHTANSSTEMSSCSTCHQPGRLVRTSQSARAFRVGFSHAKHVGRNMTCATCHTVRAGSARGRQVSNPVTAMHVASPRGTSCATCHNGKRAFGGDDFADCKRCHTSPSFRF